MKRLLHSGWLAQHVGLRFLSGFMYMIMITVICLFMVGVFIARGKEDALVTKNLVPGESVYGEKRINVEVNRWNVLYVHHFSLWNVCLWEFHSSSLHLLMWDVRLCGVPQQSMVCTIWLIAALFGCGEFRQEHSSDHFLNAAWGSYYPGFPLSISRGCYVSTCLLYYTK